MHIIYTILLPFLVFSHSIHSALWIVAQVKEINWQPNCIQDRNCENMELSMFLDSNSMEGSSQSSWKLESVLKDPQNSKMYVYWTDVHSTHNITLKSLLTANDVLFNIPRPCDQSSSLNIFSPMIKVSAYNAPIDWPENTESEKRQTIGLVGKCHHVIIEVRMFTQNCPWCLSSASAKQKDTNDSISSNFDKLLDSPLLVAFIFFILLASLIGIVLCAITLQKTKKLQNNYQQQQYSSSSMSDLPFHRNQMHSMVSNIPLPPMLRPPLAPECLGGHGINKNLHDGSICPYYETLDSHTLQKAPHHSNLPKNSNENYDSAFDQSTITNGSPNSSFSGNNLSDSGRCSPQLHRARAEYV